MGKVKVSNLLKKGAIWYDPILCDYYLVISTYKDTVKIFWLHTDMKPYRILKSGCDGDKFVRMLTPLEWELL